MNVERRYLPKNLNTIKVEKRADGKTVLEGYAAIFYRAGDAGTEYQLYPGMVERVLPTAFDRALREKQDVLGLFNHELTWILGRTSSGTCKLTVDKIGLHYQIETPDTDAVRDQVIAPILRGDMDGSSFSFSIPSNGQKFAYSDGTPGSVDVRELHDVNLHDVGPTPAPAYRATSSGIRAEGDFAEIRCAADAGRPQTRGAVKFAAGPLIDDDKWDEDAARSRVMGWANRGDGMDHAKLARAFAYTDGNANDEAHKLLHHDVRDGKLHVHAGAVERCLRSLDTEDGGGVPKPDREACRSHLERHQSDDDDEDRDEDDSELEDSELEGEEEEKERSRKAELDRMRLRLAEIEL